MMLTQSVVAIIIITITITLHGGVNGFVVTQQQKQRVTEKTSSTLFSEPVSELPDSLEDAAIRAAEACLSFWDVGTRCRVDFDTSVGDETFTKLSMSTEFMQNFVSALSYAMVPGAKDQKQNELMRLAEARAALTKMDDQDDDTTTRESLVAIVQNEGRIEDEVWDGPTARIYFPDEGSAALARRDWKVPPCVRFSGCTMLLPDVSDDDVLRFFFCPKASEAEPVEKILGLSPSLPTVFVNPELVNMGVTGYGLAGRLLQERLLDSLVHTYHLRTLPWGALARTWPHPFTVWQEDADASGGYRSIATRDKLPNNPQVQDIYDYENEGQTRSEQNNNILDSIGDFVNDMMKL